MFPRVMEKAILGHPRRVENEMKLFSFLVLLIMALDANSENGNSAVDITEYLTAEEKDKLISQMLEEDAKKEKRIALTELISDKSKSKKVVSLIEKGIISPHFDLGPNTMLLEYATLVNNDYVVSHLLSNYDYSDAIKKAALEIACSNGYVDIVESLVKSGLDLNTKLPETRGYCLFIAIENIDVKLVKFLRENKAGLMIKGDSGKTARQLVNEIQSSLKEIDHLLSEM